MLCYAIPKCTPRHLTVHPLKLYNINIIITNKIKSEDILRTRSSRHLTLPDYGKRSSSQLSRILLIKKGGDKFRPRPILKYTAR